MVEAASPSGQGESKSRLMLAFSGGPDSCGLARLLRDQQPLLAHVDHRLRGPRASREDRAAVGRIARELGLSLVRTRVHVKGSGEAGARRARFAALHALARKHGADALLTAHTMDDRAETILLQLLRGCGLRGLAALRREVSVRGLVRLRPALDRRRSELHALAAPHAPLLDASNRSTSWARSRLRAHLLPALAARLGEDPVPLLCALGDRAEAIRLELEGRAGRLLDERSRASWLREPAATFPYRVEALRAEGPPLTSTAYASLRAFLMAGRGDRGHRTPGGETWRVRAGQIEVAQEASESDSTLRF